MKSYIFLILIVLVGGVFSKPVDSDYELPTVGGEPFDGASLEAYRYYVEQAEDDAAKYSDNSSVDSSEIVKREATTIEAESSSTEPTSTAKPHFFLTDLINRVEGAIVNSAQSVVSVIRVQQNETEYSVSSTATPHVVKRSTDGENETASEEPEPLYKVQSAKLVAASPDQPAHVLIDRIAVYQAGPSFLPLISDFSFQLPQKPAETTSFTDDDEDAVSVKQLREKLVQTPTDGTEKRKRDVPSAQALTADLTLQTATHKPITDDDKDNNEDDATKDNDKPAFPGGVLGKISAQRTTATSTTRTPTDIKINGSSVSQLSISLSTVSPTAAASTSTTTTSTTQKTPVEKLKETEEDVKEKVAEIEAEPVILSARV